MAKKNAPRVSGTKQKTAGQLRLDARRALAAQSSAVQAKRRRRWTLVYTPVGVVIVVVLALILVAATSGSGGGGGVAESPAPTSVTQPLTAAPASALDAVGAGTATAGALKALSGAALTENGKPRILYVGAEWCPYCAAERWALTTALSRFGTFTGLGQTRSASNDGNIATLSYRDATYTSDYVVFSGNELQDRNHKALKTLSTADDQLFEGLGGGGFPFLDVGGKYSSATQYDPQLLAGLTQQQIADRLAEPTSTIAKAVYGSANVLTAAICKATGSQPVRVCTAAGVTAAAKTLP